MRALLVFVLDMGYLAPSEVPISIGLCHPVPTDETCINCLRRTSDNCLCSALHLICIFTFSNCVSGSARQMHNKLEKNRSETVISFRSTIIMSYLLVIWIEK